MKESKRLEEFIERHRADFDSERPSLKVWAEIERKLSAQPNHHLSRKLRWRISAAAIIILLIGIGLGIFIYPQIQQKWALQAINDSTELNEMEYFFAREVETKLTALTAASIKNEVMESLNEIDREIQKLKLDLIYAPKSSREEIMTAIIASYETKIHILQTALERSNPINISENEATIL